MLPGNIIMVNATCEYLDFNQNGWQGKCTRDFLAPSENFTDWLNSVNAKATLKYRSRSIAQYKTADVQWFIKTMSGLSDNPQAIFNVLKWCLRPSRALHIWRISQKMSALGIDCPKVILAARNRVWKPLGWPIDVLIMEKSPGIQLVKFLLNTSLTAKERNLIKEMTARNLAHFHQAGFQHGDCQPGNLFIDPANSRVCFIDNDRTRYCQKNPWGRRRNLIQLGFHMLRLCLFTPADWDDFFHLYAGFLHWDTKTESSEYRRVMAGIRKRLKRIEPHA